MLYVIIKLKTATTGKRKLNRIYGVPVIVFASDLYVSVKVFMEGGPISAAPPFHLIAHFIMVMTEAQFGFASVSWGERHWNILNGF